MPVAQFRPEGVIPAVLLPFKEDLCIDAPAFKRHLRDVAGVAGVTAITLNAHSSEVASCTFEEQRQVLEIARETLGEGMPIVNGVYADGSLEAQRIARMATKGGAAALLVFPPNIFRYGNTPAMVLEHFRRIADATDLPLIVFQYPLTGGQGYRLETLLKIIEAVPTVVSIKDGCASPEQHELHIRTLHALPKRISVLSTHSSWLYSSLVMGCDGLLSGSGSVIADLHAQLFRAVQAKDMAVAEELNTRIRATSTVFYAEPRTDMHNRMKEALVLLGKLDCPAVRPPLVKLGAEEIRRIRQCLVSAGLLAEEVGMRKVG
ncbi:MAG: dihydrodipicolinate synthase family protein [Betaproteobacteria bacterium]|nr:dihydrodipicolinate synthase family protein [Betaproteobacteria bacterium]